MIRISLRGGGETVALVPRESLQVQPDDRGFVSEEAFLEKQTEAIQADISPQVIEKKTTCREDYKTSSKEAKTKEIFVESSILGKNPTRFTSSNTPILSSFSAATTIFVESKLPDSIFSYFDASDEVQTVKANDLTAKKKVVLFAVPRGVYPNALAEEFAGVRGERWEDEGWSQAMAKSRVKKGEDAQRNEC
ncbi:hypothetical protein Droror1_Dr00006165 [Drosera rotundifolia]